MVLPMLLGMLVLGGLVDLVFSHGFGLTRHLTGL
jgi:hypothetical protein